MIQFNKYLTNKYKQKKILGITVIGKKLFLIIHNLFSNLLIKYVYYYYYYAIYYLNMIFIFTLLFFFRQIINNPFKQLEITWLIKGKQPLEHNKEVKVIINLNFKSKTKKILHIK
jgi:uncharacterized protein (DUF58 family)